MQLVEKKCAIIFFFQLQNAFIVGDDKNKSVSDSFPLAHDKIVGVKHQLLDLHVHLISSHNP